MTNRREFINSLPHDQKKAGYIKFNLPDERNPHALNGEGVWGWVTPEDKRKHDNDGYHGKITAILLNVSLRYADRLPWGTEVVLCCHGCHRPTLDPDWARDNIPPLFAD